MGLTVVAVTSMVVSATVMTGCAASSRSHASSTLQHAPIATAEGTKEALPFLHDDYMQALQMAKRLNKPLFVDAWAPWCHSCLSMRAFVLNDPALVSLADEFVWLTIDTEKSSNALFTERFPNRVWPTLWVIDPVTESPHLRWEGTATASELITLLNSVRMYSASNKAVGSLAASFVRANQAAARGDVKSAIEGYTAVVAGGPFDGRARAVEALAGLLSSTGQAMKCAELANAEVTSMPPGTSKAVVLATGLGCAREAGDEKLLRALAERADQWVSESDASTLADDRSSVFDEWVAARKALGDTAGAREAAERWAAFLEGEAKRASSKQARAVFDAHRLLAYLAAEQPERAIPMLLESERDFPEDYNPPARLAKAYMSARRLDEAQKAIERAQSRVYGPRLLRVYQLAADIAAARGDKAREREVLERALQQSARLALDSNQSKLRASLAERLRAIGL